MTIIERRWEIRKKRVVQQLITWHLYVFSWDFKRFKYFVVAQTTRQLDWTVDNMQNKTMDKSKCSTYFDTRTFNIWCFWYFVCKLWTRGLTSLWLTMLWHPFQFKIKHASIVLFRKIIWNLFIFTGYLHIFMDGCNCLYLMSILNISYPLTFWHLFFRLLETQKNIVVEITLILNT